MTRGRDEGQGLRWKATINDDAVRRLSRREGENEGREWGSLFRTVRRIFSCRLSNARTAARCTLGLSAVLCLIHSHLIGMLCTEQGLFRFRVATEHRPSLMRVLTHDLKTCMDMREASTRTSCPAKGY